MTNIDELIKQAQKEQNKVELRTYRNLKAEIQHYLTSKNAKPYSDEIEIQIFSKYAKKLEDAILAFSQAHDNELILEYTEELDIVKKFLPEPVSDLKIQIELAKYCSEKNFLVPIKDGVSEQLIPKSEMGNTIKYLKSVLPTADGKLISTIVKEYVG